MKPIASHSLGQHSWARLAFGRHALRDAEREQHELDAHERTGRVLLGLPAAEWSVVGQFEHRPGQTSHVAVGLSGVYLIVARQPEGCVRVKDGVPWSRQGADARAERAHTDINRKVLEPAQTLERQIRTRTRHRPPVHPVVVLWSEFPQRVAETRRITFVHGRDLGGWLRRRSGELDTQGQADVAEIVAHMAENGTRGPRRRPRSPRARRAA